MRITRRPANSSRAASPHQLDDQGGRDRRSRQLRQVVKTTTFGAFVELVKGTDGLLHISDVKPGERVDSVDDVLSAGDLIDVTVVEVDKERGRIGLRLTEDPSVAGNPPRNWLRSAPATVAVATAATGVDAAVAMGVTRASRLVDWREAHELDRAYGRHRGGSLGSIRSARALVRTGSRTRPGAGRGSHFLEHLLFKGTAKYSAIRSRERFDGLGAAINAATGKETTHLHARFLDEHTDAVFDRLGDAADPDRPRHRFRAPGGAEEIAMYDDEPQDRVDDVLAEAVFGENPPVAASSANPR